MADTIKPATDKRIAYMREAAEKAPTANVFSNAAVMSLIARIDAERARVAKLEAALGSAITRLGEYENIDALQCVLTMPLREALAAALADKPPQDAPKG